MPKQSIKAAVRAAVQDEARAVKAAAGKPHSGSKLSGVATADSFVNFAHKLGVGADNALTSGTYGYNPISRNRTMLEWIHRGSWLGGCAIDIVADDMTRAGVEIKAELDPGDQENLERAVSNMGCWDVLNESIKWGRLYGGCLAVMLIDGQDPKTPLKLESVGRDQFKGLIALDRWMVSPELSDLVTDYGPNLGLPKYYRVNDNAPALRNTSIHHTRIAGRFIGVELPYNQRLTENLWGISVLERLYDRMIAFDSASTGAAQLVFKAHLRTLKIPGLREVVAAGGPMMNGVLAYTEVMRRFQGIEGITLIDGEDEFEVQSSGSAISGVSDIIDKLSEQLAGALQIPLTRLLGQSPGAMSGGGDSEERTYYDGIRQKQRKAMSSGVTSVYRLVAQSEGIALPDNFALDFRSLYELDDTQKSEIASKITELVSKAKDAGLVSDQVAMQELRQSSRVTGVWTNVTEEIIGAADDTITPPIDHDALDQMVAGAPAGSPANQDGPGEAGELPAGKTSPPAGKPRVALKE